MIQTKSKTFQTIEKNTIAYAVLRKCVNFKIMRADNSFSCFFGGCTIGSDNTLLLYFDNIRPNHATLSLNKAIVIKLDNREIYLMLNNCILLYGSIERRYSIDDHKIHNLDFITHNTIKNVNTDYGVLHIVELNKCCLSAEQMSYLRTNRICPLSVEALALNLPITFAYKDQNGYKAIGVWDIMNKRFIGRLHVFYRSKT